jgi:peptidoglycan hydrolase-like protein with peptidoglycan-binding domain
VLTIASQGSSVRRLQRSLNLRFQQLNVASSLFVQVDGFFGPQTLSGVKYLQCVGGLPVDGRVGDRTWAFINRGAAGLPVLSLGSQGTGVLAVQQAVLAVQSKIATDSRFGPLTQQAVWRYQQKLGLVADGIVGEKTWEKVVRSRLNNLPCTALLPNLYEKGR